MAEQIREERRSRAGDVPVDQPKIRTMDKKLVIEAAIPGRHPAKLYRERGVMNLPPVTIEAQADAIVECVRAGASVIHTHAKDPVTGAGDRPFVSGIEHRSELLMAVMDRAFEQVDFITAHHTWVFDFPRSRTADYITHTKQLLEKGKAKGVGNRYVQI